ncbi:hypothetical protein UB46_13245 [Burkholderiaceae bacterium 16]|nr:hypothetical protein UB46_13245 [Burkholderiaceae bacterium 16]
MPTETELPHELAAPPRQQRSRDRQQALIEAGLRLTEGRDWADVTVGDIAQAIDCSVGTFYTRFRSKDAYFEVLVALVADLLRQRGGAFFAAPERAGESEHAFLRNWIALVVRSFSKHRGLYAAAVLELRRRPPAARETSPSWPLARSRIEGCKHFVAAMARRPGWGTAAARKRLEFAHQMLYGVLINAALTDPGPLKLGAPALQVELLAALSAYLNVKAEGN